MVNNHSYDHFTIHISSPSSSKLRVASHTTASTPSSLHLDGVRGLVVEHVGGGDTTKLSFPSSSKLRVALPSKYPLIPTP